MYALEFETEVNNGRIAIPSSEKFNFQHVKVILLAKQTYTKKENLHNPKIDFSKFNINCFNDIDPIKFQRETRDEW